MSGSDYTRRVDREIDTMGYAARANGNPEAAIATLYTIAYHSTKAARSALDLLAIVLEFVPPDQREVFGQTVQTASVQLEAQEQLLARIATQVDPRG